MKKNFNIRKMAMTLIAIVIVAVGLLIYGFYHPQGGQFTPPSLTANIKCLQSPEYFVIDKNPGLPGLDIIAKHKTSADENISCADATTSSDVIVQNDLPEDVIGLTEHFLIVDSGTAPPPRGLVIYDLDTQTSTYTDTYSEPVSIATGTMTYWATTKQAVTATNCPDLAKYRADGLGTVMESHVTLDLATLEKTPLGEFRCVPTQ